METSARQIQPVSQDQPCIHCGKPDWCYRLGNELSACKRGAEPAPGWEKTSGADKDATPYYAVVQPQKAPRSKNRKEFFYPSRDGQPLIKVVRTDNGEGKKSFFQFHWDGQRWVKGLSDEAKRLVPIYRYQEVQEAIAAGKAIFFVEGEGCVDLLWELGLAATTTLGGSGKYRSYGNYSEDLAKAQLILTPDRDQPGLKHMEEVAQNFPDAHWLYAPPNNFFWIHLPKSQGLDVADWIAEGATAKDLYNAVEPKRTSKAETFIHERTEEKDHSHTRTCKENSQILTAPTAEEIFTQKAQEALYGGTSWINLNGSLYKWTGTHYHLSPNPVERARIAEWCRSTPVEDAQGQWKYAYAKASFVDAIWSWVLADCSVDPGSINPPGINCLNGFLEIRWDGPKASWQLLPHDPARLCTYVSEIRFDPDIDQTECDRLLACLEPPQQNLLIQTLAASLDLDTIRRYRGREVRALLLKGHGNNGKDSLREAVRLLYGVGLANATVGDFLAYEQGRKFTLAKLEGARINWSSENSSFSSLDEVQSLKAAITGDPLDMERKGVDEHEMMLSAIFFFNINEAPNLKAGLEAIQSRWAVLNFNKTYKIGADPAKGELEADSRFRYDPEFLKICVVPGLLNKMLAALVPLAVNGIDYSCTEQALQSVQEETNHLWTFAREVGLSYQVGGRTYINDLWEVLRSWYLANGTLIISVDSKGKEKYEWHDQPRRGDKNVKAANQVHQRFAELFPKIKKERESQLSERKGQFYLAGIAMSEAVGEASEAVGEAVGEAAALSVQGSEASEAIRLTLPQIIQAACFLSPMERQELIKSLVDGGPIASPASLPCTERAAASPTASPTASLASPTASPASISNSPGCVSNASGSAHGTGDVMIGNCSKILPEPGSHVFKIGNRVAHNDPQKEAYTWHGVIVEVTEPTAKVHWEERKGMKGGQVVSQRLSDLRLI